MGVCQFRHTPILIQQRTGSQANERISHGLYQAISDQLFGRRGIGQAKSGRQFSHPSENGVPRLSIVAAILSASCRMRVFWIVCEETTSGQFVEFVHVLP